MKSKMIHLWKLIAGCKKRDKLGKLWPLLLIFGLLYGHVTKFPYTFMLISIFILAFTFFDRSGLRSLGFRSFGLVEFRIATLAFLVIEASMDFIIQPMLSRLTGEPADYASFEFLKGNTGAYSKWLVWMWISAAFGEELLFRAFIIERLEKIGVTNRYVQVLVSAAAFCLPHLYQGVTGLMVTFIFGLCFAWIFIKYRNFWVNVIIHGLTDTLFLTLSYYGLLSFYNA